MRLLSLWDDLENIEGRGSRGYYYRLSTITWSRPKVWNRYDAQFDVPTGWTDRGGVYAFLRNHWNQKSGRRIVYIGKALNFNSRLKSNHNHFDIIQLRGETTVSCGCIAFDRIRSRPGYYEEIEDILKFVVWQHLENEKGFHSLLGFRSSQPKNMVPWLIKNEGYRFGSLMPKIIAYPSIAISS